VTWRQKRPGLLCPYTKTQARDGGLSSSVRVRAGLIRSGPESVVFAEAARGCCQSGRARGEDRFDRQCAQLFPPANEAGGERRCLEAERSVGRGWGVSTDICTPRRLRSRKRRQGVGRVVACGHPSRIHMSRPPRLPRANTTAETWVRIGTSAEGRPFVSLSPSYPSAAT